VAVEDAIKQTPLLEEDQAKTTSPFAATVGYPAVCTMVVFGVPFSKQPSGIGDVPKPCVAAVTVHVVCPVKEDENGGAPEPPPLPCLPDEIPILDKEATINNKNVSGFKFFTTYTLQ
jgi:hypothetical protein